MELPIRQTSYGALEGGFDEQTGVQVFKNIPFAQALRFGEPLPPDKWQGVRPAHSFGPGMPCVSWAMHKVHASCY